MRGGFAGVVVRCCVSGGAVMFRRGYILSWREDLLWFWLLPFLAVGVALLCQQYLSAIALAAVGVWVTLPHQFASWLRTWGIADERRMWGDRLYWGPLLIFGGSLLGMGSRRFRRHYW